jgi:hypothetical protein
MFSSKSTPNSSNEREIGFYTSYIAKVGKLPDVIYQISFFYLLGQVALVFLFPYTEKESNLEFRTNSFIHNVGLVFLFILSPMNRYFFLFVRIFAFLLFCEMFLFIILYIIFWRRFRINYIFCHIYQFIAYI